MVEKMKRVCAILLGLVVMVGFGWCGSSGLVIVLKGSLSGNEGNGLAWLVGIVSTIGLAIALYALWRIWCNVTALRQRPPPSPRIEW